MGARLFVPRIDRWVFKIDRATPDPGTGFLTVDGTASRVGVLEYGLADGAPQEPWFELVPKSTLSNDELLRLMQGLPITLGHPDQMLTSENTKDFAKGSNVRAWMDGDLQRVRMSIWDAATIQGMREGTRELSLGYHATLDVTPGTWQGQHYDAVQDGRKPNHLAIIDFARAGHAANVDKFDGLTTAWTARADSLRISRQRQDTPKMDEVEIEIAGVKYMVPAPVAEQIESDRKALESSSSHDSGGTEGSGDSGDPPGSPPASDSKDDKKDKDDKDKDKDDESSGSGGGSGARGDQANTRRDAPVTMAKLDEWAAGFSKRLLGDLETQRTDHAKAVESRSDLCTKAKTVLPEAYKTDGKSEAQIMFDGIVAVAPDLKALATEARGDAAKLSGMFETALAMGRETSSPGRLDFSTERADSDPVEAARFRQNQRRVDASKETTVIGMEAARARMDAEKTARADAQKGAK